MDQVSVFLQLSSVLAIAAAVSLIMRALRQPLIVGYILTGIIVGPAVLNLIHARDAFESFSQIGITLLLFIVGLGLNIRVIRDTRKPALVTFMANAIVVGGASFAATLLLGMRPAEAVIIATAMMFSSTIVVVKALNDKRQQSRLFGQIAIGVLLIEDVIATLALLFVAAAGDGNGSMDDLAALLIKGTWLAVALVILGAYVLPRLAKFAAGSQEFLFMFAITWAFGVASVFDIAGFSIEVGALFAGVSLASLPYAQEISTRLKPLRDFFVVLFFIGLGERLDVSNIIGGIAPAMILTVLIIILKPLTVLISLGSLGYTKQTGYKVAIHLSQISEFSVILAVLAQSTGLVRSSIVDILTLTAMFTIAASTYLMKYDDVLYRHLENILDVFERKNALTEHKPPVPYKLVLFGYHKGGHEFVKMFRDLQKRYIVVDYDPDVIESVENQHMHHVYGDATDYELLQEIGISKAELVVSTITDVEANLILIRYLKEHDHQGTFICHADRYDDAAKLYEHGATYVILPHFVGSEQITAFIRKHGGSKEAFASYRRKHVVMLGKAALQIG